MRTEETIADWQQLVAERSRAKRYFDATHPLNLVYGVDHDGHAVMALLTDERPVIEDLSDDVKVHQQTREDGLYVTTWSLLEARLFDTFVALCCDVVERSAEQGDRERALKALMSGFAEWQLLLRPSQLHRLSLERLRGLVAEIWLGLHYLGPQHGIEQVVAHWSGPLGAPQDFTFLTGELHEVKAKRRTGTSVKITSVAQLDPEADKSLTLHVIELDERSADTDDVVSLTSLVADVQEALSDRPSERLRFDRLLHGLGVDIADSYYQQTWFKVGDHRRFAIAPDFPSLRSDALQPHIVAVAYKLDIQHLAPWELHAPVSEEMTT